MENAIHIEDAADSRAAQGRHRLAFGGLFLFTLLLYARPNEAFPGLLGDFPIVRIVAVFTLFTYIASKIAAGEKLTVWPVEFKMLVMLTALGLVLTPVAQSPQDSIDLLTELFLKVVTIFMLMINLLDSRERLRSMMKLVVIAGTVLAFFAISNFVAGKFQVADKHVGIRIAGVVGGIFENPNDLATSLCLLVPMAVALALTSVGLARIGYSACAAMLSIAVVLTFSRGGFLGLASVAGVLLWKLARRNRALSAFGLIATLGVFLAAMPTGYSNRITSIFDSESDPTGSSQARIDLLNRAAAVASGHIVVGVGMGNFHTYSIREQRAHNSFLEISAELGVAGLIAYLVMIFAPLRSLRQIERETIGTPRHSHSIGGERGSNGNQDYYFSVALQTSLIAYIVCSFFGSIQYLWFLYYPLAYAVALRAIHRADSLGGQETVPQVSPVLRPLASEGVLWKSRGTSLRRPMIEAAKTSAGDSGGPNGY